MNKQQYLIEIGFPSIKDYVFATGRLKSIRGASALLAHLNEGKFLERFFKENNRLSDITKISAGGGAAQFIVTGEIQDIELTMNKISHIVAQETGNGLKLIYGKAQYSPDKYPLSRKLAIYESNRKRDEFPILSETNLHTGYVRECDECSNLISKEISSNETELLCYVCHKKMNYNKTAIQGLRSQFIDYLKNERKMDIAPSEDFQAIGQHARARKNYTAVVYADGNSMGKIIRNIQTPEQFKFFSDTVGKAIEDSCYKALDNTFTKLYSPKFPKSFPGEILLLGGDDLIVYLTAEMAFPFAMEAASQFNKHTREAFGKHNDPFFKDLHDGLTISLGIAYGKVNTPISLLLNQASDLLKSAKTADPKGQSTYIDFHISTNFNQIDVSQCRKNYLHPDPETRLYQKPYQLDDARKLHDHAQKLASELPSTKLKRFGVAPTLGKVNGTLETLKLYTGTPAGKPRQAIWDAFSVFECLDNMPWKSDGKQCQSTMIIDLVELAGFIGK
jgi:hypothetical protein